MAVVPVPWDDPVGAALRTAQQVEITAVYHDHSGSEPGTTPSAADVTVFLVAYADDGTAVGCGALRHLGGRVGEIKRMYVVPTSRGDGTAAAILFELENQGRARDWTALRLETGDRLVTAQRFYERAGFVPIPLYGAYVGSSLSRCYEKTISSAAPTG